jgi:L-amino acid N-acyltransferase YncA
MDLHIRNATEANLPAIVDIYNHSIVSALSTAHVLAARIDESTRTTPGL